MYLYVCCAVASRGWTVDFREIPVVVGARRGLDSKQLFEGRPVMRGMAWTRGGRFCLGKSKWSGREPGACRYEWSVGKNSGRHRASAGFFIFVLRFDRTTDL